MAQQFQQSPARSTLQIYDTTLRDGAQREGLSLSIDDKLRIAQRLDAMGIPFIEGGWPGANPKDVQFFLAAAGGYPHPGPGDGVLFYPASWQKPQMKTLCCSRYSPQAQAGLPYLANPGIFTSLLGYKPPWEKTWP